MRMSMLTAYYNICADILKEHLPCIPELKLTNAKGYFGKIHRENGEFEYIALSKFNLDCGCMKWEKEDYEELIDTICHEFAHMYYWEHGKEHTETTNIMKDAVKSELEIRRCKRELKEINAA